MGVNQVTFFKVSSKLREVVTKAFLAMTDVNVEQVALKNVARSGITSQQPVYSCKFSRKKIDEIDIFLQQSFINATFCHQLAPST